MWLTLLITIIAAHSFITADVTEVRVPVQLDNRGWCKYRDVTLRPNEPATYEWPCERLTCRGTKGDYSGDMMIAGCPPPADAVAGTRPDKWPGCCNRTHFRIGETPS
uniref:8.9 kDa family member n=1 Tax=Rhipicephalus appendiculatus TaxID=34631 RepID=A0A131YHT7_RHIAP